MISDHDLLFRAIAFAARAHRHQLRKDGVTPYFSHCVRVMTIAGQVFGVADPKVLAAAVLHDTIEDTTTDYDDLHEQFGPEIADWVSALTKEMRLSETAREAAYRANLGSAPWPVAVCKLADIYDNLSDCGSLPAAQQGRTVKRSEEYLACLKPTITVESHPAYMLVEKKLDQVRRALPR